MTLWQEIDLKPYMDNAKPKRGIRGHDLPLYLEGELYPLPGNLDGDQLGVCRDGKLVPVTNQEAQRIDHDRLQKAEKPTQADPDSGSETESDEPIVRRQVRVAFGCGAVLGGSNGSRMQLC